MYDQPINVRNLIAQELKKQAQQSGTSLPFPCFISRLCELADVPRNPREDYYRDAIQVTNITKSKDEDNPILNKQKLTHSASGPLTDIIFIDTACQGKHMPDSTTDIISKAHPHMLCLIHKQLLLDQLPLALPLPRIPRVCPRLLPLCTISSGLHTRRITLIRDCPS